jgi:hypothetical protein
LQAAYSIILKGLEGGAVYLEIGRHEESRNNEQNKKGWAMYGDLANQLDWYGEKLTPEQWKELLSHDWQAQKIVPAISGGFCALGVRTSRLKKREMAELIELVYAFGASNGVKWSEPALACYEEYRESKQ